MNKAMSNAARSAMVAVAVGAMAMVGASAASGEPSTRLPNADLVCGSTTLLPDQWVAVPAADTLWVLQGSLAGHYVILTDTHYVVDGYQLKPPATYAGLAGVTRTFGVKAGKAGAAIHCDFVSRWGAPDDPDTFSVIGPITMARTSK